MRGTVTEIATTLSRAALTLGLLAGPVAVHAQSTTWSLPPGAQDSQNPPRAQGPVDPQVPVVAPRETAPDAAATPPASTPSARPGPVPTVTPPPPPAARTTERPQPRPAASATPARPAIAPETPPSAGPEPASPSPEVSASPAAMPAPSASEPPVSEGSPATASQAPSEPAATPHWPEWWLAIPAALLAAAGGVFVLLRRRRTPATAWEEAGLEPEAEPEDELLDEPAKPAAPAAVAALEPPPTAAPAGPEPVPVTQSFSGEVQGNDIEIVFEPVTLRLSLVYATLQYRLAVTAPPAGLPGGLRILADMISAHASLSQAEQLAPDPSGQPLRHSVEALTAGETREFKGELQLPLSAIRVMRQGQASLFVPLVRLSFFGEHGLSARRVFTLGLPGEGPGVSPLRLDTGPRDHAQIASREIEAARTMGVDTTGLLPLDPRRAAV